MYPPDMLAQLDDMAAALWEVAWYRLTGIPWAATLGPRRPVQLDVELDTRYGGHLDRVKVRGTALDLLVSRVEVVRSPDQRESMLRLEVPLQFTTVRTLS